MRVIPVAAATLAVVTSAGIGAAIAPVAGGQSRTRVTNEPSVVTQLLGGGSRIGVSIREVDPEEATRAKLPAVSGVVIDEVTPGDPAEKAGFKAGDVVVEFDGERVRGTRQFARLVQETPASREVQAVVVRDGQRTTLSVRPEASSAFRELQRFDVIPRVAPAPPRPATPPAPHAPPPPEPFDVFPRLERFFSASGRLGIRVDSLSEQLAEYFGTKEGVLVTSVTDDSAAAKAGLKAGDVIVSINGIAVDSPPELSRRTQRLDDGEEFTLEIVRNKQRQTIKGKVEPRPTRRWTTRTVI